MQPIQIFFTKILVILLFIPVSISCSQLKEKQKPTEDLDEQPKASEAIVKSSEVSTKSGTAHSDCDPALWDRVYNPSRLEIKKECLTVTGVIEESSPNSDGDHHMLLKLDAGQDDLLTKKNMNKKDGYLVIEAVCVNTGEDKKVKKTCKGYVNNIKIPDIGAHVRVTGSYVIDSHNGWAEIHPISKIEVIK